MRYLQQINKRNSFNTKDAETEFDPECCYKMRVSAILSFRAAIDYIIFDKIIIDMIIFEKNCISENSGLPYTAI